MAASIDDAAIGAIFREEFGRSVAALIRVFGDIDLAEDAVSDAFAVALRKWPEEGLPPNPGGWITTTARNRAIDRLRRRSRERALLDQVVATEVEETGPVEDDRLRLIFTCCHPALASEAQVALTLRLLGGLTTSEVARAFLVEEPAMAQRIVRAKRKIKAARIPYRVPEEHELPDRVPPVLAVVYLIANGGTPDLAAEALRLARLLRALMPDEPEVAGLLSLLLFVESRRAARTADDGSLVVLGEQDRSRWDASMIDEARTILQGCLRRGKPGPYQLQAAINAVHADASSVEETDWQQIVALYDHLIAIAPTPVIALNRAIAIAEIEGPASAMLLIDELNLDGYYAYHAARGDLLRRLGRDDEAAAAFGRAAALAPSDAEREFLGRGGRRIR